MFKWMYGKGSLGYWIGAFALFLPLMFLVLALPFVNHIAIGIVFVVSQWSYLTAIELLTRQNQSEIRQLKKQLSQEG